MNSVSVPAGASGETDAGGWLSSIARDVVSEFSSKGLTAEGLSISVLDLRNRDSGLSASQRGDVSYYPASVVKAFYLAYYEARKESGALTETPELARAVRDMIRVSSNDATGFVVDSITGTTSGPEITGPEWESWKEKRNAVNRYFEKRGYRDLNANQKTFCEDAYGREQAFRDGGRNRNRMTPDAVARLFAAIARGEIAGPAGTAEMLGLLSREVTSEKPLEDGELEDARLAGHGLPPGTRVWAKSGDAYDVHHLVARIVLPDGGDFVVAVFTKGVKTVPDVIPRVFARVAARFAAPAPARRP
ncbi:MAG: class A beta-lactamase-related serine hydrolase [Acidobacteria bacterium]|nr:class A beta-lactamase-related serine hydrolase [Acidobacteriota bacterium]